jgi:hypothetical protein
MVSLLRFQNKLLEEGLFLKEFVNQKPMPPPRVRYELQNTKIIDFARTT